MTNNGQAKRVCIAFNHLLNIQYKIILGRKGKLTEFIITFDKKDFHHLVGLHKLTDLPYLKKDRGVIFDQVMDEKITIEMICKSPFFERNIEMKKYGISKRIDFFKYIEAILDSNNLIFKYNKGNTNGSNIDAEYLFENKDYENILYIFIDKCTNSQHRFCRSFFPKDEKDYSKNQTRMTLVYKEKINLDSGESVVQLDKLRK